MVVLFAALAMSARSQMSVESFDLVGSYQATAFSGSGSGTLSVVNDPDGYTAVIPETTLGDATGTLSANVFGVIESVPIDDGFRMAGFVLSDIQTTPFYEFRHMAVSSVVFELDRPTEIRVAGSLAYQPEVVSQDYALSNATVFEIRTEGMFDSRFFEFVAPPTGDRQRAIDRTVLLPAGRYEAYIESESNFGGPLSTGLLNVDTSWDLSITVVPAPATLAAAPVALLASRRRR